MRVRIRIKLGVVRQPAGVEELVFKVRRWLSPTSAVALALALWRLAYDLNWTGRFAFSAGLFSHWQFWMGLALMLQILDSMLGRYAMRSHQVR